MSTSTLTLSPTVKVPAVPQVQSSLVVHRFGVANEFSVRVAASTEDRRRAWALAYRVYRDKQYAQPNAQELWYSEYDLLPDTVTLLFERHNVLIGAVTVVPDSPLLLPADKTFPEEVARLRQHGGRPAEAISLIQADLSERTGMLVIAKLCEFTCLLAHQVLGMSDLVITVNPRHVEYYHKSMLFERQGGLAQCEKVSSAPAVFLTLNFAKMNDYIAQANTPGAPRTIYRRFMEPQEMAAVATSLREQLRPMDATTIQQYFVTERSVLPQLPSDIAECLADAYRKCGVPLLYHARNWWMPLA